MLLYWIYWMVDHKSLNVLYEGLTKCEVLKIRPSRSAMTAALIPIMELV